MGGRTLLKAADLGAEVEELTNAAGNELYKTVRLEWSEPIVWRKGRSSPTSRHDPCVYVMMHDHGNAHAKKRVRYVGLTKNPSTRFLNHPTARAIVNKPGEASVSFAFIEFIRGRNRIKRLERALEEIEHLLIWVLDPPENTRKMFTLPGMGKNRGNAWHIHNNGYRFHGQLPQEIVFPWFLVRAGRNRTEK